MMKRVVSDLQAYVVQKKAASPNAAVHELKQSQLALWESDRAHWRITQPFLADLADALELIPVMDDRLASATTDGRRLYFDVRFSAGLSTDTRRFLQAHLVWHCVLGHILSTGRKDNRRWHLACDHEVNWLLFTQGFSLPDTTVLFCAKLNCPAQEVYDWLSGHPALEREHSQDWTLQECTALDPKTLDDDFVPVTPDRLLIAAWHSHAQMLARDYRQTPYLPEPIAIALSTSLKSQCLKKG